MNKFDTVEEYWDGTDLLQATRSAGVSSSKLFEERLSSYLGVDELHSVPSARWGLSWLLTCIRQTVKPGVVLVPAFNCGVVAEAIRKSGNTIEGYDFSNENGSVEWDCLAERISSQTLEKPIAIIVTHFFGVPVNWLSIRALCKRLNIFVIEDCAHTLGGSISGHMTGSLSDASIYSFNYDKPISLGWGGAVVCRNELLSELWRGNLFEIPSIQQEQAYLNKFLLAMKLRRNNIGKKANIATKVLLKTGFRKSAIFNSPNVGIGPLRSQLGIKLIDTFENIRAARNANAGKLRELFPVNRIWNVDDNVDPSWLRMKMKIDVSSSEELSKKMFKIQKLGYRAGNFNWPTLIDSSHDFPNAEATSQLWIDVPIHQNLSINDLLTLADNLSGTRDV